MTAQHLISPLAFGQGSLRRFVCEVSPGIVPPTAGKPDRETGSRKAETG